jgi:hypothetical protein
MGDKACAGGCATVLEVRIPGERRLTNALWTLARTVWNAPTIGREPTILVGRAALATPAVRVDPVTREAPGIPNYPRVRVDTSGRGTFNSRSVGNVNITRGFVDSTGARPSISLRGGNFRITFYGVVENSVGAGFTMRITGSDRGDARGTAQARFNQDLNEVELINVSGRIGRDDFSGNFNRR